MSAIKKNWYFINVQQSSSNWMFGHTVWHTIIIRTPVYIWLFGHQIRTNLTLFVNEKSYWVNKSLINFYILLKDLEIFSNSTIIVIDIIEVLNSNLLLHSNRFHGKGLIYTNRASVPLEKYVGGCKRALTWTQPSSVIFRCWFVHAYVPINSHNCRLVSSLF